MTNIEISEAIAGIAHRLGHLQPSSRNPEQYHEEKSELLRDLGRLREAVRLGTRDG